MYIGCFLKIEISMFKLFLFWLIYYGFHSFLASSAVKAWVAKANKGVYRYYRLGYSLSAILGLIALAYFTLLFQSPRLFQHSVLTGIGFVLIVFGLLIQLVAIQLFNLKAFIGIEPTPLPYEASAQPLIVTGMYRFVRHPLYFGVFCMAVGLIFAFPFLHIIGLSALTIAYLFVGSYWEEKKLILEFGSAYEEYRKKVKGIVPFVV